jgi:hypothetical protein
VISVVLFGTLGTNPPPDVQRELIHRESAVGAPLRAGEETIDLHEVPAVPLGFVLQLSDELSPSNVADPSRQFPIPNHSSNIEIFDHDRLVFTNESSA